MLTKANKKVEALKKAAADKRNAVLQRVLIALQTMQEKELPINFESLANYAHVSKVWLYSQPEISAQIKALRNKSGIIKKMANIHKQLQKKDQEITVLNRKIKGLEKTILKLRQQLETVYGELYKLTNTEG